MALKLGLNLGYWGIGPQGDEAVEIVQAAEKAGFDSVWAAESYGSDAVSVLAYLAAKTETIQLGAAILQVPARPPAAAAMAGATIDALSGGRFIFGFGPSGPQVSEGWYGVPYAKPWGRTREYVEVVEGDRRPRGPPRALGRALHAAADRGRGRHRPGQGAEAELPPASATRSRSTSARSAASRSSSPPRSRRLDPDLLLGRRVGVDLGRAHRGRAREGRAQPRGLLGLALRPGRDRRRPRGRPQRGQGWGCCSTSAAWARRKTNFYVDLTHRFGFGEAADEVQSLYLDGKREEAFAAIPDELVDGDVDDRHRGRGRRAGQGLRGAGRRPADRLAGARRQAERMHTIERLARWSARRLPNAWHGFAIRSRPRAAAYIFLGGVAAAR